MVLNESDSNPFSPPEAHPAPNGNWLHTFLSWDPNASQIAKEIRANMTRREQSVYALRGIAFSVVFAFFFSIHAYAVFATVMPLLFAGHLNVTMLSIAVMLVPLDIAAIMIFNRKERRYLCSTEWARKKAITPEGFSLYRFSEISLDRTAKHRTRPIRK